MIFDLPQVAIPALLYNALLCSLAMATGWHVLAIVERLRGGSVRQRNRDR